MKLCYNMFDSTIPRSRNMRSTIALCTIFLLTVLGCGGDTTGPSGSECETTSETFSVSRGDTIALTFKRCGGCVYRWHYYKAFKDIIKFIDYDEYVPNPDPELVGQAVIQEWTFIASADGHSNGIFLFRRLNKSTEKRHLVFISVR
jgi:hypothetical protein